MPSNVEKLPRLLRQREREREREEEGQRESVTYRNLIVFLPVSYAQQLGDLGFDTF